MKAPRDTPGSANDTRRDRFSNDKRGDRAGRRANRGPWIPTSALIPALLGDDIVVVGLMRGYRFCFSSGGRVYNK